MKVILTSRVKNLGNIGDVVSVKDGYARNFLIPKGYAMNHNASNAKLFEAKKQEISAENARLKEVADSIKSKLEGKKLILIENSGDDGRLYGSVNTVRLAQEVSILAGLEEGAVKKANIILHEGLKNIGVYTINVELHSEVSLKLTVIIARSMEEAKQLQKAPKDKEQNKEEK